jgi:hypothetical protein
MKILELLLSLLIASIIIISYYFTVFSRDKINNYTNLGYAIFLSHIIVLFILTTIILYLFITSILNSKQIYPRGRSGRQLRQPLLYEYNSPDTYEVRYPINTLKRFPNRIQSISDVLNENTRQLFTGSQRPTVNKYAYRPGFRGEKWE